MENFRPQSENPKQNAPEAGAGPLGLPPPGPEQAQWEGSKSPERHPPPSVWAYLERHVRLQAQDSEDRPRPDSEEYTHEAEEVNRLSRDLAKRGTHRDRLIRELYGEVRCEPAPFPSLAKLRNLSLEEFQQFRSRVEPLADEQIAEEIRKAEEEFDRKSDEFFRNHGGGFSPLGSIVRV
jgi:hypothetical protein